MLLTYQMLNYMIKINNIKLLFIALWAININYCFIEKQ